jgi:hypothetical protein
MIKLPGFNVVLPVIAIPGAAALIAAINALLKAAFALLTLNIPNCPFNNLQV